MDEQTCNLEIQKHIHLLGKKLIHFSKSHSIEILQMSCRETKDDNYFVSVIIRHSLTGNKEETSIDYIKTYYS